MEQTNKKFQYILWGVVLILGFAVISLVGIKVFYGLVVPQVQAVNQLGIFIVLGFSFIAGLAAFLAPCPFAVFPAYIAYYLNIEQEASLQNNGRFLRALKIGFIVSLGIFSFYGVLGIAMSLFGAILASYAYYLKLAIIPVFFILGWMLIAGKSFGTRRLDQLTNVIGARARGGKHFTTCISMASSMALPRPHATCRSCLRFLSIPFLPVSSCMDSLHLSRTLSARHCFL